MAPGVKVLEIVLSRLKAIDLKKTLSFKVWQNFYNCLPETDSTGTNLLFAIL